MAKKDNHRIRNIYYMLSYAFQTIKENGVCDVSCEDFDHVHDLFASILAKGISAQVKRGLHRDYLQNEESLACVRGRILVAETLKQQTQILGRLVCSFDEFHADSLHNQILKCVMRLLARNENVKPENKKALLRLLPYFSDVLEISPETIRWDTLKYHRNNASYRMLLGVCRLAIKGLLQTTEAGTYKLSKWIQDEEMHRLYERFVFNYYEIEHRELRVTSPHISWDIRDDVLNQNLPIMKTDVTLEKTLTNGSKKRLIIDTKYYSNTMQKSSHSDKRTFISWNLYQIYTYVKNSSVETSSEVAGVLLYAKTDEEITPNAEMNIGGNRFSVKTLDLDGDWNAIKLQLDNLCNWLNES